ncbi:GEVED domain-containing protein [Nonomuraea dietziae]|uniref:GEVED domain-containing protein n=1 Tax=Nonomuraea dietziae TaxID=65515 RepID=UPI0033E43390
MYVRKVLTGVAAVLVGMAGIVPMAHADGPQTFTNSATEAHGSTASGVQVTVRKTPVGGTKVVWAQVAPADPAALDDEFLIPANAKAGAGILDLYEEFEVNPNGWSDVVALTFTFSRPVRDPRLHVYGTGGVVTEGTERDDYWAGLRLMGGTPATPTFSKVAGFPGYRVTDDTIVPERFTRTRTTTCGVVYTCGTVQVNGTLRSFTIMLRARDVRYRGDAGSPQMWGAFKLSLYEDASDAPASYGAASHILTDTYLGNGVTADHTTVDSVTPRALRQEADTDDAIAAGGPPPVEGNARTYTLAVPVGGPSEAALAGWIDFDRNGKFDPGERAQASAEEASTTRELTWSVPRNVKPGATWLRLRTSSTAEDVTRPTGWADSGEVEDHQITLAERVAPAPVERPARAERPDKGDDRDRRDRRERNARHMFRPNLNNLL